MPYWLLKEMEALESFNRELSWILCQEPSIRGESKGGSREKRQADSADPLPISLINPSERGLKGKTFHTSLGCVRTGVLSFDFRVCVPPTLPAGGVSPRIHSGKGEGRIF